MVGNIDFETNKLCDVEGDFWLKCHSIDFPNLKDIFKAFNSNNNNIFLNLNKDFAVAFFLNNKLFLIRDPYGNIPLYYFVYNLKIYFSDNVIDIINLPFYKKEINTEIAFEYLNSISNNSSYNELTIWNGIYSVIPGQVLILESTTKKKYVNYFKLEKVKLIERKIFCNFKDLFLNNLKNSFNHDDVIGSSLSGGLDSSSISSCLQYLSPKKIVTIERRSEGEVNPERHFAQSVVEKWKTKHYILTIDKNQQPNYFKLEKELCKIHGLPSNQYSIAAYNFQQLNKLKENNCNKFFFGHGGDDVLVTKGHYIDELVYNNDWRKLKFCFNQIENLNIDKKLNKYEYTLSCSVDILIFFLKNFKIKEAILFYYYSLSSFLKLRVIGNIIFLMVHSISKKKINNYNNLYKFTNKKLKFDFNQLDLILKDNDNENFNYLKEIFRNYSITNREQSYQISKKFNIEYYYPFLNTKILNLIVSAPKEVNFGKGLGRNILRESMDGILPIDVQYRLNKTEFSRTSITFYQNILLTAKFEFTNGHKIWEFINKDFFYICIEEQLLNFEKDNFEIEISQILKLIKIVYFGIWLETFF